MDLAMYTKETVHSLHMRSAEVGALSAGSGSKVISSENETFLSRQATLIFRFRRQKNHSFSFNPLLHSVIPEAHKHHSLSVLSNLMQTKDFWRLVSPI